MSQTIQAAQPVRPAVLAVIALHAALVVALAMNFRHIPRPTDTGGVDAFYVPLPRNISPPNRNGPPIGPTISTETHPTPTTPEIPVEQSEPEYTTFVPQSAGDAISEPKPFVWVRPQVVDRTEIPYPREDGVQPEGIVRLRLLIGIDGRPLEVVLGASSGHKALDRAALKAVAHWRFKPRLLNGQPVESWAEMPIVFRLEN